MAEPLSEAAFLNCINRHFPNQHHHMLRGRGDDCAILKCPPLMCLSKDLFLQDAHFRTHYFSAADIGHKALAVNISDLAGSGAVPLGFSFGLMAPSGIAEEYWDDMFASMAALAEKHDLALTGGDISKSPYLGLSITVWGAPDAEAPQDMPFLERGQCAPGDAIFIIGTTGLARTGLLALEDMGPDARKLYPKACAAHLRPHPLVAEGIALARFGEVSLMDLSDGLSRDLPRLLGESHTPRLGADITLDKKAIHPEVESYALANDLDPLEVAMLGGEDYALLGTCSNTRKDALLSVLPAARFIGTVTDSDDITLNGLPWGACGFDHFSQ